MSLRASLRAATLHYGNGVQLHTAASGSVAGLHALYLCLNDGQYQAVGEVRANIAYLNGYAPAEVIAHAEQALAAIDWREDPAQLLASMAGWAAPIIAPVRNLIDCALHDLLAQRAGVPLAQLLAPGCATQVRHATNQTLFWSPFEQFIAQAEGYVARGFHDLKVRIGVADFAADLQRLGALRERFGEQLSLAVDVNGQWGVGEAPYRLEQLARFNLAYVEQPIGAGDWPALEQLAARAPMPLMLDESLASAADIERLCALGGALWAHVKLVKFGGLAPSLAALRQLRQAGVTCMVGQMNEGAAATAAALHLACASTPRFAELYGADGLRDDPASPVEYTQGHAQLPAVPGLGVTLDLSATQLIRSF